ncbi:MAG: hypothetical protein WBD46_15235 [Acidobacteriaceae bacterium]
MPDKVTITWTDLRGHQVKRDVALLIDVERFRGTPGYALLVVAANTNLSVGNIERYLTDVVGGLDARSRSWIQRRRWLFQQPDTDNSKGRTPDGDGQAGRAVKIMRANPNLSVRGLVRLLREHAIKREREWVRKHRCDPTG